MPYRDPEKRRKQHQKYMKEVWYPRNKEKHKKLVEQRRKKIKKELYSWINSLKEAGGCVDCGVSDFRVLDFDHRNFSSKVLGVAQIISKKYSYRDIKEILLSEIVKCEIRCANCHRIKTWERRGNSRVV